MTHTLITTDGGEIQVSPPQGTFEISAGDAVRLLQIFRGHDDLDEPTVALATAIEKWLYPDVWLIGRPGERAIVTSIHRVSPSQGDAA